LLLFYVCKYPLLIRFVQKIATFAYSNLLTMVDVIFRHAYR